MRNYYSQDPKWINAKFNSRCHRCQCEIKKGDKLFYYPRCKTVYCDKDDCGKKESASFEASAQDEYNYSMGYGV